MSRNILIHHTGEFRDCVAILPLLSYFKSTLTDINIDIVTHEAGRLFYAAHPLVSSVFSTLSQTEAIYHVYVDLTPTLMSRWFGVYRRIPIRITPNPHISSPQAYLDCLKPFGFMAQPCPIVWPSFEQEKQLLQDKMAQFLPRKWVFLFIDAWMYQQCPMSELQVFLNNLDEAGYNVMLASNQPYASLKEIQAKYILNEVGTASLQTLIEGVQLCEGVISGAYAFLRLAAYAQKNQIAAVPHLDPLPWNIYPPAFKLIVDEITSDELTKAWFSLTQKPQEEYAQQLHVALSSQHILYAVNPENWPSHKPAINHLKKQGLSIVTVAAKSGSWSLIKQLRRYFVTWKPTVIQYDDISWAWLICMTIMGRLYTGHWPKLVKQSFHPYIRLQEYLSFYTGSQ